MLRDTTITVIAVLLGLTTFSLADDPVPLHDWEIGETPLLGTCEFGTYKIMTALEIYEYQPTTVLLVRHAEKAAPYGDPPLSVEGEERAEKLAHVAAKAGVTAIYHSNTLRAEQTVTPLADVLDIVPDEYEYLDVQGLVNEIKSDHAGEVVLVVGHSDTVPQIIKKLGGDPIAFDGDEYDNLFVITFYEPRYLTSVLEFEFPHYHIWRAKPGVVNLQYGEPSP